MLYANTRIRSILRQPEVVETGIDVEALAKNTPVTVTHEKEIKLAKQLVRFPEVVNTALEVGKPVLIQSSRDSRFAHI